MKVRKVPLRRCTGCGEMKPKPMLVRIVHGEDGSYAIDLVGKQPGRGAYICRSGECLAKAAKNKGLERSFKGPVPKDVYEQLKEALTTATATASSEASL